MLEQNRFRVRNLSGAQIWMFIVARVLLGFVLGALLMRYVPSLAEVLIWPALIIGALLFVLALRGMIGKADG